MNSPKGQYTGAIDCAIRMASQEGFAAFYKGLDYLNKLHHIMDVFNDNLSFSGVFRLLHAWFLGIYAYGLHMRKSKNLSMITIISINYLN